MSPGFHWKWAARHPIRALVSAYKFSKIEGISLWEFPYTFYSLGWGGGGIIDKAMRKFGPKQSALVADDRIMTKEYDGEPQ